MCLCAKFVRCGRYLTLPLMILAAGPMAVGQDDSETQAPARADVAALKKAAGAAKKSSGKKRFPEFKEVIKDMKVTEGLFTLYRYDPKDKNRDPEKLLAKIPARLLKEDMLFTTSISRGGRFTGWMWSDHLIRWEIAGKHLKIIVPDTNYVQKKGKPITDAVKRTYNERFIATTPIVTMAGSDPVIDLGSLLKSNLADVSFMGGSVRSELSKWTKTKVFPDNILIDVDLAMSGRGGGALAGLFGGRASAKGGTMLGVSYAFRKLPKLGSYKPRAADDRVGYFLTAQLDWSKKSEARDTFDRYINRWNLEKRDPSLELSPPKKPVTYIIEKTVPIQWRRWVRQGILEWNKAFEQIGIVDAIVVQQQTDDNEFAKYDPEDSRYNFFRWIVSGTPFAMGPSRADPRTGQILDADIIMDDSMVRVWMTDFDVFAPATVAEAKGPGFRLYLERFGELIPEDVRNAMRPEPREELFRIAEQKLRENGHRVCSYATGLRQQINLAYNALISTATGKKIPERFIGEVVRHIVTHEVGHTLGLRHNFKASSWLSLDEIKKRRNRSDDPTTASVMDYNPILFFAEDELQSVRHFTSPTIGPYDYWAIKYGYAAAEKMNPEAKMLAEIASKSTEEGLAYATDEDTMWVMSPDPLVNRFDCSADPIAWAKTRIALCDKLLENISEWAVNDGEPRYYLTQAFNTVWGERASNFNYVSRLIGGQYFNRDHQGQENARPAFVIVDPDLQRGALELLKKTLFNDEFFSVEPELLNSLAPRRWSHWGSNPPIQLDYPIHQRIAMMQLSALIDITAPPVLQRIYDAELKSSAENKLTAAELIRTVRDHVWSGLDRTGQGGFSDTKPMISSITRGLQRQYLRLMLAAVRSTPGGAMSCDLHGMMSFAIRELSGKIDKALEKGGSKLDFASRAHLTESKSRIDRALNAQFSAR